MSITIRGVPASVTAAQHAAYKDAKVAAVRALGVDPNMVVRDGVEFADEGFYVTVIVPHRGWDGSGDIAPSQLAGDSVATNRIWVPIHH